MCEMRYEYQTVEIKIEKELLVLGELTKEAWVECLVFAEKKDQQSARLARIALKLRSQLQLAPPETAIYPAKT